MAHDWSYDWPTEPGEYWFHGWKWAHASENGRKPETYFVTVRHDATGSPLYVTDGHFLFKAEGARGVWQKAELPTPPLEVL